MTTGIFSLLWDNIDDRIPSLQKRIGDHLDIHIRQHKIDGIRHSEWMNWLMASESFRNIDTFLFIDIDCFPINRAVIDDAINSAKSDKIFGCAQSAAHLTRPQETYAGPFFLSLTRDTYQKIGNPSFHNDKEFDVGQRITVVGRERGIEIDLIWPTEVLIPRWNLGENKKFGIGTTYGGSVFHLFECRKSLHIELFEKKAEETLKSLSNQI